MIYGKTKYYNQTIGNRKSDNKDKKNRQKAGSKVGETAGPIEHGIAGHLQSTKSSVSSESPMPLVRKGGGKPQSHGNFFRGGQNSPPANPDNSMRNKPLSKKGDSAVMTQAKRQKKIIRKDTSYTDGAISRAKMLRGM